MMDGRVVESRGEAQNRYETKLKMYVHCMINYVCWDHTQSFFSRRRVWKEENARKKVERRQRSRLSCYTLYMALFTSYIPLAVYGQPFHCAYDDGTFFIKFYKK